jgi:hypothetical protein
VFNFILELTLALLVVYLIILLSLLLPSFISMMEKTPPGPPSPTLPSLRLGMAEAQKSFVRRAAGAVLFVEIQNR